MKASIEAAILTFATAHVDHIEDKVEVVYIQDDGPEKGCGVLQARAKQDIKAGCLRLYPDGGTLLQFKDSTGRRKMEHAKAPLSCHIRGVHVKSKKKTSQREVHHSFVLYSAMSHTGPAHGGGPDKPVASLDVEQKLQLRHLSPFWAVMLAGRDHDDMINMKPCVEEFTMAEPIANDKGLALKTGSTLTIAFLFFSNAKDLCAGDMFVLPHTWGTKEIYCDEFPPGGL